MPICLTFYSINAVNERNNFHMKSDVVMQVNFKIFVVWTVVVYTV